MRILFFAPTVGRGGVTRVVETLTEHLTAHPEVQATILGQTFNENGARIHWPDTLPFIQVRPVDRLPDHPDQFEFLLKHGAEFGKHALELEAGFDLIWCAAPWWSLGHADCPRFHKTVVANIPDFAFDQIAMGSFLTDHFRAASLRIANRADLTIFGSEFQRQWAISHYGFTKTQTIHYSIEFSARSPAAAERLKGLPEHYLLAFHCMDEHKGLKTMLRGFAEARLRNNEVPPLVIAGLRSDDLKNPFSNNVAVQEYRKILFQELKLKPGKDVFVLGELENEQIPTLYHFADACLVASRSEGDLSGTVHEAILYECPLIFSDIPVFREQLQNGVHGLSFSVDDPDALASAIDRTVLHLNKARDRAAFANLDLSNRSAEDVVADHLNAFRRILEQQHA